MSLNKNYIGKEFPSTTHTVTQKEIQDYSAAIGASNKIYYNSDGFPGSDDKQGLAPPGFQVIYEMPALQDIWSVPELHGGDEQAKRNVLMLVHGEQGMTFHNPVKAGDTLKFSFTLSDIADKSSGQLLKFSVCSTNQYDSKVADSDWSLFIRAAQLGSKPKPADKSAVQNTRQIQDLAFRKVIRTGGDIAHIYSKASNDKNPIHTDDNVARKAGFNGVILHGLCTMSMAMNAIVDCYLDSDPYRLKKLSVRFSAPVYPGDLLIADGWVTGKDKGNTTIGFEVVRKADGVRVISGGMANVAI
jgi:acyl dehydratase